MWADFVVDDALAFGAAGKGSEEDGDDSQVGELGEDLMCIVGSVVAADAGVVASDDEMGAAVVFPHDGMVDGFAWSGVFHAGAQNRHHRAFFEIVVLHECLVGFEDDVVAEVSGLFFADDRVDEDAVNKGECGFLDVFMADVWGVSGLEGDDFFPAFFFEENPCFFGCEVVFIKGSLFAFDESDGSCDEVGFHCVDGGNAGVAGVLCLVDVLGECFFVIGVKIFDVHDGVQVDVGVFEKDGVAGFGAVELFWFHIKCDGYGPGGVVGEAFVLYDGCEFVLVEKAGEW